MRCKNWTVVNRRGALFSLPGPGDGMLFRTKKLAEDALEEWLENMDPEEVRQNAPLRAERVFLDEFRIADLA